MAGAALMVGALIHPESAASQQISVSGTVTEAGTGQPVSAATVRVTTTGTTALTDAVGRYTVQAPSTGVLSVGRIGYQTLAVSIAGRTTVDIQLQAMPTELEELVVTGYGTQRRADITTAVSSVDLESTQRESSSSVLQRLAGRVPGVTVETSGSPGARSTVRIRGVSSFQNNNPLYIIDGTPVEESYANFLNPHDIESMQVLKDASAASIYGARANNGVVIITTRKGQRAGAPQVEVDAHFGLATPTRGYDDFLMLDPLDYFEYERLRYVNAGQPVPLALTQLYGDPNNPTVPAYTYAHPSAISGVDQWGRPTVNESAYAYPGALIMPGSAGTNWWDAVFGTGQVRDVNMAVRGGGANERYSVGLGYFDQLGTARYNRYQRGTVRVNTDFNVGRLTVGENFSVALEESYGGLAGDGLGEGNIIGKNILSQPVIPVRDIAGNYASGKGLGLGNNTNPLKIAENGKDNRNNFTRVFGNAFARFALTDGLTANSSLGVNAGEGATRTFNPIFPENSEPTLVNSISENHNRFTNWTWNNTLDLRQTLAEVHSLGLMIGHEAIWSRDRRLDASMANLVSTDVNARYIQPALGDPATRNVTTSGGTSSLLSFFGRADYNFDERYYLSGTLRRDGSSRLGASNQWGTFPAFSLGWRVSQEGFLRDNPGITNLMLRFGWGITGNQNIAAGRTIDWFGGATGNTFYDIDGSDTGTQQGYRQVAIGNPNLLWEENETLNLGLDLEFMGGSANFIVDVYQRDSDNLLFNPPLPATAGLADAPIVNIGQMRNRGVDASLGFNGTLSNGIGWNLDLNGSHYKNEIIRIDGNREFFFGPVGTRTASSVTINQIGHAIGSFYGREHDGFFQTQAEIDALNQAARQATGDPSAVFQDGARPGRFKFRDVNGDGRVTDLDRTVIGSPHPDFTGGINLGLNWGNFDLSADVFGTFGNDIFDVQKEFYVFRIFPTNVRQDIVDNSWQAEGDNAKYPRLDATDTFSQVPSSFYVEDGSYVRMRTLQVGYAFAPGRIRGFDNVRVYLRGENLFTITGYDGLDPSLPALDQNAAGMDVRDQARGIDRGVYPTNRTFSIGVGLGF